MIAILADAGTPLMWAGLAHLTIGNLLIGLLETAIVRWRFADRAGPRLIVSIIIANYISCVAGYYLINAFADRIVGWAGGQVPIYSIGRVMAVLGAASFVITILVEFPFFWFALGRGARFGRSLGATLLANAASYVVLLGWYWLASVTPARWGVALVRPDHLPRISNARVFYISPDGNDIMQMRLDGSGPARFCRLPSPAPEGALGFTEKQDADSWNLAIQNDYDQPVRSVAKIGPGRAATRPAGQNWMFNFNDGDTLEAQLKWTVRTGYWAAEGVWAYNKGNDSITPIMAVEMPWLDWPCRCATVLPNDQIVFQLGQQIIRVDLKRKIAAAIAAGHGPVVVLDN